MPYENYINRFCSSVRTRMNIKITFDPFEAERLRPRNEVTNLTLSIRDNV